MKHSTTRLFALAGIVGSILLMIIEVIEVIDFNLTINSIPLAIIRLLLQLLLALAVWAIYRGQAHRSQKLSLIGAVILSTGFIYNTVIHIWLRFFGGANTTDWVTYFSGEALQNPVIIGGALLVILGMVLFGIAIIRANVFPRWTGAFMIAHPIFVAVVLPALGRPITDGSLLDLLFMGMPFLWASWLVWSEKTAVSGNLVTAS